MPVERRGLSSPDKVLWPEAGFTKADLWDYYTAIADRLLAQVADRPLTLRRHPSGVDREGFMQKHLGDQAPDELGRFRTWSQSSNRSVEYLVARRVQDLWWAAQMAVVELHPWLSRIDRPEHADTLLFDLDPSDPDQPVGVTAWRLREALDDLGLSARVKSSGKRGLHIHVAVQRRYRFTELRGFALAVARWVADQDERELTVEMRKADRKGRLLIDWSRNGPAQHVVAPWSPRATPLGTVAVPLDWDELTGFDPAAWTLRTATERPELWTQRPRPQRIERARRALERRGYLAIDRSPRARTSA